jgi:phage FluMu protein Com
MDPLHATIEEFAAEGFTHVQCYCPQCRVIRLRPISWLPRISLGLTIAQLSAQLRCAKCGGPLHSVKPGDWKMCSKSHSGVEADLLYEAPTNICCGHNS